MKALEMIWWMILLRGISLLFLGILAIAWPGITLIILAYIFALYVLAIGIINTIHGITGISGRRAWFISLLLGIAQIAVSMYVLQFPGLTLAIFVLLVGFSFLGQGILEIIIAFTDRDVGSRILDIVGGILGILAGFFILRYPISGGLAFVWVIGVYGIVVGSIAVATALSLHTLFEDVTPGKAGKRLAI